MLLNQKYFLCLLILFHIIKGMKIISNLDEVIIEEGITIFEYYYIQSTFQEGRYPCFFFTFNYANFANLTIKDENNNFSKIKNIYSDNCFYQIKNVISQKFTFIIEYPNMHSNNVLSMLFVDNSKEINTNLEKLSCLNFFTEKDETKYQPSHPLPLIFKLDSMKEKVFLNFDLSLDYDDFMDDKSSRYMIEYCEIRYEGCEYKGIENIIMLEKGISYKIKYDCVAVSDYNYHYFRKFTIKEIIKEVGFGFHEYILISRYYAILFDIKDIEEFFLYLKPYNDSNLKALFINQTQKSLLFENITIFYINLEYHPQDLQEINYIKKKDLDKEYFLLINYNNNYEKGFAYFFNSMEEIQNDNLFEIGKGMYGLIKFRNYSEDQNQKYAIVSSTKSMKIINSNFNNKELTNLLYLDNYDDYNYNENQNILIYALSLKENTKCKCFSYKESMYSNIKNLNLITELSLNSSFKNYGPDSLFMRTTFSYIDYNFYNLFFFGLDEEYYLYIKQYFGNIHFYKYKKELDIFSNIEINYHEYELINSTLLNISGFQLYSFYNSYGTLYDLYFQKVNDLERIQINKEMYQFGNLVKLLEGKKKYFLDFNVDHLIVLDKEYLDAEIIFTKENNKFFLNENNTIIKDLKGVNITVMSNKTALIYFYKSIENTSNIEIIEFDKNQTGKNMKFNISNKKQNGDINILIIKDFSFMSYYPMIKKENFMKINNTSNNTTIYVENLYDKLDIELYENEKYYIYVLDNSGSENIEKYLMSDPIYFNNLFIPNNTYNFHLIPPNSNGSIILNTINKDLIQYKLFTCQNDEIKFKIDLSNNEYSYETIINKKNENEIINFDLKETEILSHSFESKNELLFIYTFYNSALYCDIKLDNFSIISIDEISKNLIKIEFSPIYINCLSQYYIIISKKDKNNNKENLSDPCYVSKIILYNFQDLIVKTLVIKNNNELTPLISLIDISKLFVDEDDELVATILGYNSFILYKPVEFTLENKNLIEFKIGEQVEFNFNHQKIFFKFDYKQKSDSPQIINFNFRQNIGFSILLIDNLQSKRIELHNEEELINITFTKSGTYYLEFYSSIDYPIMGKFTSFISGNLIDTIYLNKKMYYENSTIKLKTKLEPNIYKVKYIIKDTLVYFSYYIQNQDYKKFICPFEICNDNTSECKNNITRFKFIKGNEYTIKINFITKILEDLQDDVIYYYYPSYVFFPISENIFREKEEGFYLIREPKIYIVNLINKGDLYLHYENANQILLSYSNDNNKTNIVDNLNMKEISDFESISCKENYNYGIIMIIPFMDKYSAKFIIANILIKNNGNQEKYTIPFRKNAIIFFENKFNDYYSLETKYNLRNMKQIDSYVQKNIEVDFGGNNDKLGEDYLEDEEKQGNSKDDKDGFVDNILTTFSSEQKIMTLIREEDIYEYYDFIAQNSYPFSIYVNKPYNDIIINIKTYKPRYTLFGAINNNLFENYINFFFKEANPKFNFQQFPLYFRINSDYFKFNGFSNFYLYEPNAYIYFKNFYGETDFYECNIDSIDKNNLSDIAKPSFNFENKTSILYRIHKLKETKLIAGYLDHNSFYDLYIDLNINDINIKLIPYSQGMYRNAAKFLQKDKEYKLDFNINHLVKLDSGFNTNVSISGNNGEKYIINSENRTAEIKGINFTIISNNDAMIYFYGKLFGNYKQYRLEPKEGQNIDIKINSNMNFAIDFGFEGYFLNDFISLSFFSFSKGGTYYMENIYEKLKTNLIDGESLYLYYINPDEQKPFEITYSSNINNPKNNYTFNVISKNDKNKSLIINNYNFDKIFFQINFCSSSTHNVKIYYHPAESSNETIFEFKNNKTEEYINNLKKYPFKLTFESNEDFIFSYSFLDSGNSLYLKKDEWASEINRLEKLIIDEFMNYLGIISFSFKPNYNVSLSRYIIIIAPLNESNIIENLYYPCYITKLLTDKNEYIKIINTFDTGDNNFINVNNINIFDLLNNNNKFIIDIISQELKFVKKINYYTPIEFNQVKYEIEFEKEENFSLKENFSFYNLKYEKKSQKNEIILLHYHLEQETPMRIKIISEINYEQLFNIDNKDGYLYFPVDKKGNYRIKFEKMQIDNLTSTNNNKSGDFKIIYAENPFNIDIKRDKLAFNEFNISRTENESVSLIMNIEPLDKEYTKKISIPNIGLNKINNKILIQKNNEGYKPLNFSYYTFEKNITYNISINFTKKKGNVYTFERTNIIDFSSKKIIEFLEDNITNITYNFYNDKFIIINWINFENISITIKKNNAKIFISNLSEDQLKNVIREFQNLHFQDLNNSNNLNISKPSDSNYSVLYIELDNNGTEINFFAILNQKEKDKQNDKDEIDESDDIDDNDKKEEEKDDDKDDKKGLSTLAIVLISIFGFLFIFIIIFFILKYFRKKNTINFELASKTLDDELLFIDN